MTTENPKIQHNNENQNKPTELMILMHQVFECTDAGKRLLELMKKTYVSDRHQAIVFPMHPHAINQFGGSVDAYCGFRSGQANVIFNIEEFIEQCKQMNAKQTSSSTEKIVVA